MYNCDCFLMIYLDIKLLPPISRKERENLLSSCIKCDRGSVSAVQFLGWYASQLVDCMGGAAGLSCCSLEYEPLLNWLHTPNPVLILMQHTLGPIGSAWKEKMIQNLLNFKAVGDIRVPEFPYCYWVRVNINHGKPTTSITLDGDCHIP